MSPNSIFKKDITKVFLQYINQQQSKTGMNDDSNMDIDILLNSVEAAFLPTECHIVLISTANKVQRNDKSGLSVRVSLDPIISEVDSFLFPPSSLGWHVDDDCW